LHVLYFVGFAFIIIGTILYAISDASNNKRRVQVCKQGESSINEMNNEIKDAHQSNNSDDIIQI
jgi:uncharacterized membrane protein